MASARTRVDQRGLLRLTTRSPHPHAALLFLDYLHSKEGQQVVMKGGLNFPRDDMDVDQKFKMKYLENQYSLEEFERSSPTGKT